MDISTLLNEMTVDEKIAVVSGTDFMYTNLIPRFGVQMIFTPRRHCGLIDYDYARA